MSGVSRKGVYAYKRFQASDRRYERRKDSDSIDSFIEHLFAHWHPQRSFFMGFSYFYSQ
jgi:hypothetical protein